MALRFLSLFSLLCSSVAYAGILTPKSVAVRQYGGGYGPPAGPPSTSAPSSPPTTSANPSTGSTSSSASGLLGDKKCGSNMCVTATVNGTSVEYLLSSTRQVGWMAVGFGNEMVNTPMVLMWPNSDGSVTLSQRQTSSYTMPTVDPSPARVATLGTTISTASSSEFRFTVEAESQTTQNIIYAFSRDAPSSAAEDARIAVHQEKGMFTLDLSKPLASNGNGTSPAGSTTTPFTNTQKLFVAHAVFCGLGFLFLLPSGVLLARFFRTFTPTWFQGHWFIQFAISGPVILIGFALAIAAVAQKGTPHFTAGHKVWGLVLILLYLVQCSLGGFIHFVKPKHRIGRPPQNYGHAVLGLLIIALAFFQVRTGYMDAWPTTGRVTPQAVNIIWIVWIVLLVLLYTAGLALLRKQFRQEKQSQLHARYPSDASDKHELRARSSY